jgi:hypothetical protein
MNDARGLDGDAPAAPPTPADGVASAPAGAETPSRPADQPSPEAAAPTVPDAPWTVPPPPAAAAPAAAPAPAPAPAAIAPAAGGIEWGTLAFLTALLPAGIAIGWWMQGGAPGKR